MTRPKAYLAGPDVFLPDARRALAIKADICRAAGLEPLPPVDGESDGGAADPLARARAIARGNEALMDRADLIVADFTPFRGPGMDAGTAFEVGYMRALGKPVFAYTNLPGAYMERVQELGLIGPEGTRDRDRLLIEDFGLAENLMLATVARGGVFAPAARPADIRRDLESFRLAVAAAAEMLT
ncbi:nucleoside 2-deoxyribosyltransferase [Minwuia thermotolerans]|uniref:Nucleoside 2-deoxyribosyltransferase n=1 Tax=Minwuia thermotolerans TaxID=2056226 RepID=A0A2M9FYJ9_9PROT|nr:nucleoside 2-deoxyribosyltransferase [Minwuia thermotolerans]PJK28546.1 nucleoside 2-deoxyribosyltransferase [Minwuia thermotolerans]